MSLFDRIDAVLQIVHRLGKAAEMSANKHSVSAGAFFDYAAVFAVAKFKNPHIDIAVDQDLKPEKLIPVLRELKQRSADAAKAYSEMCESLDTCIAMAEEK